MLKNNKIKLPLYLLLTFTAINCSADSSKNTESTSTSTSTKKEEQSIIKEIDLLKAEAGVLQAKISINTKDNDSIKGTQEDSKIYTELQTTNQVEYTRLKELSENMIAKKNIESKIKDRQDKLANIQGIFTKIGSFVNTINGWDNDNLFGMLKGTLTAGAFIAVYSYLTKNEEETTKEEEENSSDYDTANN
jgi:hypothetical protein